jgi:hypothetical protein
VNVHLSPASSKNGSSRRDREGQEDPHMQVEVHLPPLPSDYLPSTADLRLESYYVGLTNQMRELEKEMRLLGTGSTFATLPDHYN